MCCDGPQTIVYLPNLFIFFTDRRRIALKQSEGAKRLACVRKNLALVQTVISLPGAPANGGAKEKAEVTQAEFFVHDWVLSQRERLCDDAWMAGDAPLMREAYMLRIEAEQQRGRRDAVPASKTDETIGKLRMEFAERWVTLTGDRAGAAGFYRQGYQQTGKKPAFESLTDLPVWWPPVQKIK